MNHETIFENQLVEIPGSPIDSKIKISSPILIEGQPSWDNVLVEISNEKTRDLFPPTVFAYQDKGDISIRVNAMVLFPFKEKQADKNKFQVRQQFVFGQDGKKQLNIYISYYAKEIDTNQYIPILVSFKTNPIYDQNGFPVKFDQIQTFFGNIDPRTSRGTITTVKRPV